MKMKVLALACILALASFISFGQSVDYRLEHILTERQQDVLNVKTMTPEQKRALFDALAAVYKAGRDKGREEAAKLMSSVPAAAGNGVIESKIDGDFEGWEGETVVKLINGQIWQQSEYYYYYYYAFMPDVLIYSTSGGYKMKIDGIDRPIGVVRLK